MSIVQIIPPSESIFGRDKTGSPIGIDPTWYLFLYNISQQIQNGTVGVYSFNTRTGAVTLTSGDVISALAYTPYNAANPSGFISGNQSITLSGDVTGSGTTAITTALSATGVTAGSYSTADVTVDAKGRITSISSGTSVGTYLTPLVWTSGADLSLGIQQSSIVTASAATSIPLHIACGDGQIYAIDILGSFTTTTFGGLSYLQPNNSVPSTNSFDKAFSGANSAGYAGTASAASADGGFVFMFGSSAYRAKLEISTSTQYKSCLSNALGNSTTYGIVNYSGGSKHNDTTTVWSSFGTIILPNAWTGSIVITRIQ